MVATLVQMEPVQMEMINRQQKSAALNVPQVPLHYQEMEVVELVQLDFSILYTKQLLALHVLLAMFSHQQDKLIAIPLVVLVHIPCKEQVNVHHVQLEKSVVVHLLRVLVVRLDIILKQELHHVYPVLQERPIMQGKVDPVHLAVLVFTKL